MADGQLPFIPQVPYPRWGLLFSRGELRDRLVSRGFDPEQAAMLDAVLYDILEPKATEEEYNYRFLVNRINTALKAGWDYGIWEESVWVGEEAPDAGIIPTS